MAENLQAPGLNNLLDNSEKKKGGSTVVLEDFFWDQFIKYISSTILALTVLNVSVEFLRGGGIFCFPPSNNLAIENHNLQGKDVYEFGTGQTNYINNYCSRIILKTEYFPIYILIHGIFLILPHYIWTSIHRGDFGSFFSVVNKLDHLKGKSGEYDSNKFDLVIRLEQEYSGKRIFFSYILKLLCQLAVCIGSLAFTSLFFLDCELAFSFCCPDVNICVTPASNITCSRIITDEIPEGWPLTINVPCIYTSLRILNLVRYADLGLLVIATLLVIVGLVWCCFRHTEQLGHEDIAKFSFESCLNPECHSFPSPIYWPSYRWRCQGDPAVRERRGPQSKWLWPFTHYPELHLKHLMKPKIENDMNFLVLMLFRADTAHGQIFKSIQISKDLKALIERDNQQLHLFSKVSPVPAGEKGKGFHRYFYGEDYEKSKNPEICLFDDYTKRLGNLEYVEELYSDMRHLIYEYVNAFEKNCCDTLKNDLAVDVSFGSVGFARVLARPFKKVVSLDFSSDVGETTVISDHFYEALKLPDNSFAKNAGNIALVKEKITEVTGGKHIDLVVVGPLLEASPKKVIVKLLLSHMFPDDYKHENKSTCLLIVHPVKVGSKKVGSKQGDSKQGDSKKGDSKQGDSKQGDSKKGDSKQGDSKKGDSKKGDSEKGGSKQGDSKQGDSKKGDSKQGDSKKGDSKKGDSEKGDSKKGDSKKGDSKKLTSQFALYVPPEEQFKSVTLSMPKEHTVKINEISCVFEFAAYKYSPKQETSASSQVTGETSEPESGRVQEIVVEIEPDKVLP